MPIVDVQIVAAAALPAGTAGALVQAVAAALNAAPGRVWLRLHPLRADHYAENAATVAEAELPAFVTVLHARPPQGEALAQEVRRLTAAVALCLGRPAERIHLEYAPAGAGRIAFGGTLVR